MLESTSLAPRAPPSKAEQPARTPPRCWLTYAPRLAVGRCVGPFHTPLADVGLIAQSHTGVTGAATAVGEQPIKGLLSPAAMARLAVSESLTNLVWAAVTDLGDVKCSANWMWAAKLAGEGAAMYEACSAMSGAEARLPRQPTASHSPSHIPPTPPIP